MTTTGRKPNALMHASARTVRLTVGELRERLADVPDWAEVRITDIPTEAGYDDAAVWDLAYARGVLEIVTDDSRLPSPRGAYDEEGEDD